LRQARVSPQVRLPASGEVYSGAHLCKSGAAQPARKRPKPSEGGASEGRASERPVPKARAERSASAGEEVGAGAEYFCKMCCHRVERKQQLGAHVQYESLFAIGSVTHETALGAAAAARVA
jgi:hypothetical protein